MIQNSFIFLEGIGAKREKEFWSNGISDWDRFIDCEKINKISKGRKLFYNRRLGEAKKALFGFDSSFFNILSHSQNWRLYDFFKEDAVFLDIETTGLDRFHDDITVFGIYDGLNSKTMIKGINMDYDLLKKELQKYKLIITFNGSSFDVPFINKRCPDLLPKIPNFDVKFLARYLGYQGGLKKIERDLGYQRPEIVNEFNGGDALSLWKMYKATGDEYYLNLLVEYNELDIVNLKKITDILVSKIKGQIFS